MTAVGFEWKMIPSADIEGYRLYRIRSGKAKGRLKRVAQIDDRYSSHYVDTGLKPGVEYLYQMSTYDAKGFESRQSKPVSVKTLPMIPSVSFVRAIANLPNRIKIIWRPHQDLRVVSYVVERAHVTEPEKWKRLTVVKNRLSAEYIDKDLGEKEVYLYRIRVKLCNGLVSKPSTEVKAITKPLPKPPVDVKATTNLPHMIHLRWKASPTSDVVYYKVYRSPFAIGFYSYRAKTTNTFYDDKVSEDGKVYYYKISAVDKDGLESPLPKTPVYGKTLDKPSAPIITAAKISFNQAIITWEPGDSRADRYDVIRTNWDDLRIKKKVYKNIYGTKFVDKSMRPGIKYTYRIIEIDKNGLRSESSKPVELFISIKE